MTSEKRTTIATIKSFIRKAGDGLYIRDRGNGQYRPGENGQFIRAEVDTEHTRNSLGVRFAWFVGHSRDYFSAYDDGVFAGFEITNCCGHFILAVKKVN